MGRKIVYLVNPVAGVIKKEAIIDLLKSKTEQRGFEYEIQHTSITGNYDLLRDRIKNDGVTDIVMLGGDGTVNQAVSALCDEDINFGIIPLGSGNGLAFSAGIPKNPLKALSIIFDGKPLYIDAFKINGHFSCMLSGLGFDAHVAHEFSNKASRGLLTYTQQSLFHYFKAYPYQFEVVLQDFSFYTEAFFITIANSNQFGNNFTIAPKASLSDGLLDIVVVQKMSKARLPFAVLRQIRGNNQLQKLVDDVTNKNILYFQTPSLKIRNLKHAPFHVDGEPMETVEEYQIDIIKDCFRLIQ